MLALIISIFIISSLYRNQSARERYRILKGEIEELEALEKNSKTHPNDFSTFLL